MKQLDAKGLICPLPVLKARKALVAMAAGERLEITVTDDAAPKDFALFCEEAGHRLLSVQEQDSVFVVTVERGSA